MNLGPDAQDDDVDDVQAATLAESASEHRSRRAHRLRQCGVVVLVAIFFVAASGVLDREVTGVVDGDDGETLSVTHPRLLRPGADLSLLITVRSSSPTVTLELPRAAFEQLGIDGLWPEPETQTARGETVQLGYDNPTGEVAIEAVGRLGTAEPPGDRSFTVAFIESDLEHELPMWVLP